jgi:hypothetical protein
MRDCYAKCSQIVAWQEIDPELTISDSLSHLSAAVDLYRGLADDSNECEDIAEYTYGYPVTIFEALEGLFSQAARMPVEIGARTWSKRDAVLLYTAQDLLGDLAMATKSLSALTVAMPDRPVKPRIDDDGVAHGRHMLMFHLATQNLARLILERGAHLRAQQVARFMYDCSKEQRHARYTEVDHNSFALWAPLCSSGM